MIQGGFLPLPNGFLPATQRGGFAPPSTLASDPMAGVARDATSNIYRPANASQWTTALAAAGLNTTTFAPSALWLLQEASGNPADSIGSFTLTASGSPSYQQNVTGWTSKAITFTDGAAAGIVSTSASLPDLGSSSHMVIAYVVAPAAAPATTRNLVAIGTGVNRAAAEVVATTGLLRGRSAATAADSTSICDGAVHPIVVRSNRTGTEHDSMSDALKASPVFNSSVAGTAVRLGTSSSALAAAAGYLYAVSFHGAAAEMTDAQIKTLLQTLGWTVTWS